MPLFPQQEQDDQQHCQPRQVDPGNQQGCFHGTQHGPELFFGGPVRGLLPWAVIGRFWGRGARLAAVGGAASAQGRYRSCQRWCGHRPQNRRASSFVVQVADHVMARLGLTLLRCFGLAALGGVRAAGVELAAGRRVGRGRDRALQHDTLAFDRRVRDGDGREQRLGVGVQRGGRRYRRSRRTPPGCPGT